MKKREINSELLEIILIIVLFLIILILSALSSKTNDYNSEGTLNTIFLKMEILLPEPFLPDSPWKPYGEKPGEIIPIPEDLNKPIEHSNDVELPPPIKTDSTQKPTPAPPKPIYDFWKKFWESIYRLFNLNN